MSAAHDLGASCAQAGNAADQRTKSAISCDGLSSVFNDAQTAPPVAMPAGASFIPRNWGAWAAPELVDELRQHWAAGLTVAEIATHLGVTKNAVSQKARRLMLPSRGSPIKGRPHERRQRIPRPLEDFQKPEQEARPWTEENDRNLIAVVEKLKGQNRTWRHIYACAARATKRSAMACEMRLKEIRHSGGLTAAEKRKCLRCRTPFLKQKDIWICSNCKSSEDYRTAGWQIA